MPQLEHEQVQVLQELLAAGTKKAQVTLISRNYSTYKLMYHLLNGGNSFAAEYSNHSFEISLKGLTGDALAGTKVSMSFLVILPSGPEPS